MSENLQALKRRIRSARNIAQVARAMEMISASKIRKAKETVTLNKPYAQKITALAMRMLSFAAEHDFTHPYVRGNDSEKHLLLVVSSDKGLCGSLNTNLERKFLGIASGFTEMIALGKKATRFCRGTGCRIIHARNFGTSIPPYSIVYPVMEIVLDEFLSGRVSSFSILYSEFVSVYSQVPSVLRVLPVEAEARPDGTSYAYEPGYEAMLEELLPYYLEVVLYETIIEAFTSEQAARMMAMNNAKSNAEEMGDYLTLLYNKSRQEKITDELQVLSNYAG